MDAKAHWQRIYQTKGPDQVSWYQAEARLSCALIQRYAPDRESRILDVGAGASTLVDGLLRAGYRRVTVLDLSRAALDESQRRLGADAGRVAWREEDVLTAALASGSVDVWHDRAVFHFLTAAGDREQYVAQVRRAVRPGGWVVIATFAEDGPERCSGLETRRYSAQSLQAEFGADFLLEAQAREEHITPGGARQAFTYCACRYQPA
ncbi:MAG: class I SAM-dependent methyltransferase [Gemmatimonadaceae bacterium]|nr:class I SAM-dependent methyltransferase [Gemmatimonadaceae bacterium]